MPHILIIDMDKKVREFLGELIAGKGFSYYEAHNVFEALVYLTLYDFDGIITDLNLPYLSGPEFAGALHARLRPPFPPIIALTKVEELTQTDRSQLLTSGISLIVSKPLTGHGWKHILNLFAERTPQAA